ncbi:MAG: hypothetical protein FJ096_18160 [Deltaproteobacteria bacterium]|nr:hypothetical protein [Deltaproteobacteria bacterium]
MPNLPYMQIVQIVLGIGAFVGVVLFGYQALPTRARGPYAYLMALATVGGFFFVLSRFVPQHDRCVELAKAAIAIGAAGCVFYEQHRKALQRPIDERWKRFVGVTLALAAITAYFNGFNFGYPRYYHRWDQYHYYMGAKYFPELGYTNLYKCGVIAEEELGSRRVQLDRASGQAAAPSQLIDFRAEMRDPDKKVRDLGAEFAAEYGGENLLIPGQKILEHPEQCRKLFSDARWAEYKEDVAFFRVVSGKQYWTDMQKDHGFNPPPVWTIMGRFFSDLAPTSVHFLQFLATLDLLYLAGMFAALWWGFGWRVFAVGAIFWGCQASAPFYWTGGAFLRQDWLFFLVLSTAAMHKRYFKIGGAALVYAGLLRIFPGLVVIGTLVPFITHLVEKRRIHPDHKQALIGGTIAALVLVPLASVMTMKDDGSPLLRRMADPYVSFYEHTLEVHDKTPLTNHMGLRVIVAHKFIQLQPLRVRTAEEQLAWKNSLTEGQRRSIGWTAPLQLPVRLATGPASGQMEFVRDEKLTDPFKVWKDMRNERYRQLRYVAYAAILATLIAFSWVVRRTKSLWIAQCLGQIFVILLSQLTCYYYSFMILGAPLTRVRRSLEIGLFGVAAITQIVWMNSVFNDNKYTLLTLVSLAWCAVQVGMFWRRPVPPAQHEPADENEDPSPADDATAPGA